MLLRARFSHRQGGIPGPLQASHHAAARLGVSLSSLFFRHSFPLTLSHSHTLTSTLSLTLSLPLRLRRARRRSWEVGMLLGVGPERTCPCLPFLPSASARRLQQRQSLLSRRGRGRQCHQSLRHLLSLHPHPHPQHQPQHCRRHHPQRQHQHLSNHRPRPCPHPHLCKGHPRLPLQRGLPLFPRSLPCRRRSSPRRTHSP